MQDKNYDEENVVEETTTEETAPEENTDETTESEEETEEASEESTEDEESVDWKERALKAEKAIEKAKRKQKTEKSEDVSDPDRLNRLELKADGIKEPADQDYVLRVAKAEGIDPIEAAQLEYVQDKLAYNKRQRQSAQATPRSNNRAGGQVDEIAMLARKYEKDGSLPDEMAKVAQIMTYLKNNN